MTLEVLGRAGGLVAIAKPAGRVVIPGRTPEPEPPLNEELGRQLGQKIWVVHRLDRETSGVLLFALDEETHRAASLAFEHGQVKKRYLALVQGDFAAPRTLDLALVPARKGKVRPALPGEAGKPALTEVTPVERFGTASLVACVPLTGRQHQLRVHLRAAGHPLLVDRQYGRKEPLTAQDLGGVGGEVVLARTPLHAARAELLGSGFEAPLPADLERTLALLRARPA